LFFVLNPHHFFFKEKDRFRFESSANGIEGFIREQDVQILVDDSLGYFFFNETDWYLWFDKEQFCLSLTRKQIPAYPESLSWLHRYHL